MPITQEKMIEQIKESRAAHNAVRQQREQLIAICDGAKQRYYNNRELFNVLDAIVDHMKLTPIPDDRATYLNEQHYRRAMKGNVKMRKRQEIARRMAGIPTQDEALAILHAKNALRRIDLPTDAESYANVPMPTFPNVKSDQERRAEELLASDPFTTPAKPSRPGIIFPRDDPDDPELEFETQEELALIANLPTGAVAIVDPLTNENNSQEGIDNEGEPEQDGLGNAAKED